MSCPKMVEEHIHSTWPRLPVQDADAFLVWLNKHIYFSRCKPANACLISSVDSEWCGSPLLRPQLRLLREAAAGDSLCAGGAVRDWAPVNALGRGGAHVSARCSLRTVTAEWYVLSRPSRQTLEKSPITPEKVAKFSEKVAKLASLLEHIAAGLAWCQVVGVTKQERDAAPLLWFLTDMPKAGREVMHFERLTH